MKIINDLLFCNQMFDDTEEIHPVIVNLKNVEYIGVKTMLSKNIIEFISINFINGNDIAIKPTGDINDFFIEMAKHCNTCE